MPKWKKAGYIWLHKSSDHGGRHIHVYDGTREIGVYDLIEGPIRGLEIIWSPRLQKATEEIIKEIEDAGRS